MNPNRLIPRLPASPSVIRWFGRSEFSAGDVESKLPTFDPACFSPTLRTRLLILQPTPFCNIDCSYCYLPNRQSTARMGMDTLRLAAQRLHDDGLCPSELSVVWHAGEPLVLPVAWYDDAFGTLAEVLEPGCRLTHSIQTNSTLIDQQWCALFLRHRVRVGVSVDGPADLHDAHRRTRQGRGTHARVMQGMALLRENGIVHHAIAVVTPATFVAVDRFADFFEANPVSELGCNVDEAEGGHAHSSLEGHEAAHAAFLQRLLERSAQPGSRLRVRELAYAAQLIAQPLPEVRWGDERWPLNAQTLPFALVSVAHDGHWSTFSPELLGQAAPQFHNFVFGNVHQGGYLDGSRGEAFARTWDGIVRGIARCRMGCAHFGFCGGGAPANKFYENGSLDSAETLYCRSMLKRPFEVVLAQLEAEQRAIRSIAETAADLGRNRDG